MNKKYEIVRMHICGFERKNGGISSNLLKYPVRLCVFDPEKRIVIDVETGHQYPYVKIINMKYFSSENGDMKIEEGKRYGCIEYATILSLELDSKQLDECKNIIELLNNGHIFPNGNEEFTNEQYLEMVNSVQKTDKSVKKLKKRK